MIKDVPPIFRNRERRLKLKPPTPSPEPGAPALVSATYVAAASVTLTFDRAVDVAGLVPETYAIDDGPNEWNLSGTGGPTQPTPQSVTFELEVSGPTGGSDVRMYVPTPSGVVAAAGGLAWSGVEEVVLPFGS